MVIFNVVSGHMICAAVMCDLYMRDQWLVGLLEILLRIHECAISLFTQKTNSTHNSTRNSDSGMNMMVFELYLGTHYKYTFMYIIIYNIIYIHESSKGWSWCPPVFERYPKQLPLQPWHLVIWGLKFTTGPCRKGAPQFLTKSHIAKAACRSVVSDKQISTERVGREEIHRVVSILSFVKTAMWNHPIRNLVNSEATSADHGGLVEATSQNCSEIAHIFSLRRICRNEMLFMLNAIGSVNGHMIGG